MQARLKGALVTRLARPDLCVINTHPVANHDGDWSAANRFYPLHRAELAVLARVVTEAGPRWCSPRRRNRSATSQTTSDCAPGSP